MCWLFNTHLKLLQQNFMQYIKFNSRQTYSNCPHEVPAPGMMVMMMREDMEQDQKTVSRISLRKSSRYQKQIRSSRASEKLAFTRKKRDPDEEM